jgi:hypothetical protein
MATGDGMDGTPERCSAEGNAIEGTTTRRGPSWTRPTEGATSPARAAANRTLFRRDMLTLHNVLSQKKKCAFPTPWPEQRIGIHVGTWFQFAPEFCIASALVPGQHSLGAQEQAAAVEEATAAEMRDCEVQCREQRIGIHVGTWCQFAPEFCLAPALVPGQHSLARKRRPPPS